MRTVTQNILIVEDDNSISELLRETITKQGYTCEQAYSGTEAMLLLRMKDFSLVLLDLMIPGISGEEVLEKIREQEPNLPVMILTAKDTLDDKIQLLADGADDYIIKPYTLSVVKMHMEAVLKRLGYGQDILYAGNIRIEINAKKIYVEDQYIETTPKEFELLYILVRNQGKVLTRDFILDNGDIIMLGICGQLIHW